MTGYVLRSTTLGDVPQLMRLERTCFPTMPPHKHWWPGMLEAHVEKFPDGQWVLQHDREIVGSCTNLRVPLTEALAPHTWLSITGDGWLTTHEPDGDTLYGTEVMVHPAHRRHGLGRRLYQARKDYVVKHGLRAFATGGRIPDYAPVRDELTVEAYVADVVAGRRVDRVLTPQLKAGLTVEGILEDYITDTMSGGYATLLVWWAGEAAHRP